VVKHVHDVRNDTITGTVMGKNQEMSGCKIEQSKNYKAP